VDVPTPEVFKRLGTKDGSPMSQLREGLDYEGFVRWLMAQRNDLQTPAEAIAPEITEAIARLKSLPAVSVVGMSGSGATCFAVVKDMATARHVARIVQVARMEWWVAPAALL